MSTLHQLKAMGLTPSKRLGQNFLFDPHILQDIVNIAGIQLGDIVIEVGPGPGGLSQALLRHTALSQLIAIETDARAIQVLQNKIYDERFQLLHQDAMQINWCDFFEKINPEQRPLRIVANLPYNIGTLLVQDWLEQLAVIASITVMLQAEVAERLIAVPGTKAYGRLSVITQAIANVRIAKTVGPEAFVPPPKVDSAVVHLTPRVPLLSSEDYRKLCYFTKAAFAHRRKVCKSNLKGLHPDPEALLQHFGLRSDVRAEDIPVATYVQLANTYTLSI